MSVSLHAHIYKKLEEILCMIYLQHF
jgi:hypothetical protein